MIIDELGLPKDVGASDKMDSARLAGLMVLSEFKNNSVVNPQDLAKYVLAEGAVRHPAEVPANNPKNFSRDQLSCLAAGLCKAGRFDLTEQLYQQAKARNWRAQNVEADVVGSTKKLPDGADILSPSVQRHLLLCTGAAASNDYLGKANLVIDILYRGLFARKDEINQLLALCAVAGSFYMKLLKLTNNYEEALRDYWSGWRGEPELAEHLINFVKGAK